MSGSHSHYGNGNGSASHVNGGAQRDGNRVSVLANTKALTQLHVYRDVSGRAAGKEGVHAGVFYAAEYDGVGVLANVAEG